MIEATIDRLKRGRGPLAAASACGYRLFFCLRQLTNHSDGLSVGADPRRRGWPGFALLIRCDAEDSFMPVARFGLPALPAFLLALGGCGTYVPEIQEPPGDSVSGQQLVDEIVHNIRCEVQDAIYAVYSNPSHQEQSAFLDNWGVQMTLSLQVEEKSGLTPVVNWIAQPATVFNMLFGGTLSADATRIDKMNFYHTVAELRRAGPCNPDTRSDGQLLLQSDLKLKEWLYDSLTANNTHEGDFSHAAASGPFKQNVISHEVKFEILTAGTVTPGWKLKTVSINQTGVFLTASRDRTNDLIITLGPAVPTESSKLVAGHLVHTLVPGPSQQAAFSHLSSEIGTAVSDGVRGSLLQ